MEDIKYAGFGIRLAATIIDTIVFLIIALPLILWMAYGRGDLSVESNLVSSDGISVFLDYFLSYIFPIIATLLFWHYKSATPGKLLLSLRIVDANSGGNPTTLKYIIRYFGYFVSSIFFLGFIWIIFDKRKQGWHDKFASTVVIVDKTEKDKSKKNKLKAQKFFTNKRKRYLE